MLSRITVSSACRVSSDNLPALSGITASIASRARSAAWAAASLTWTRAATSAGPVSALRLPASRWAWTMTDASSEIFDCASPTPSSTEASKAAKRSCCSPICAAVCEIRWSASRAASRTQPISGLIATAAAASRSAPPWASPIATPTPSRISAVRRSICSRSAAVRSASDADRIVLGARLGRRARQARSWPGSAKSGNGWRVRRRCAASSVKRSSISASPRSISAIIRCDARSCSETRPDRPSSDEFARSTCEASALAASMPGGADASRRLLDQARPRPRPGRRSRSGFRPASSMCGRATR